MTSYSEKSLESESTVAYSQTHSTKPEEAGVGRFAPRVVDALLDKLSSDDDFRELFQKNPRAALSLIGHTTSEADRDIKGQDPVLCCYNLKGLASKEAFVEGRMRMRESLTKPLPQSIFWICAS